MKKLLAVLGSVAVVASIGCEEKKKVQVDAPGVQVKTGETGTEVKTPNADVEVKQK